MAKLNSQKQSNGFNLTIRGVTANLGLRNADTFNHDLSRN